MEILQTALLRGLTWADYAELMRGARERRYTKGACILHAGETSHALGMVLEGVVCIEHVDVWGGRGLLGDVKPGEVFAEIYALCGMPLMVDAVAARDARVLFVDVCALRADPTGWRAQILHNLLDICAQKNMTLSRRMLCLSPKSVRARLLTYLSSEAARQGGDRLVLPFDRQQMADYLGVERSALSRELGRMRQEGLIDFRKNHFTLMHMDALEDV